MPLIRNTILFYAIGFIIICGLRFMIGQDRFVPAPAPEIGIYNQQDFSFGKRNIITASRKIGLTPTAVDQKYEQIANIANTTETFEEDEAKTRAHIATYEALIQFEQRSGLDGYRNLQLAIGVAPDKFDALITDLKSLGTLTRFQIDKTDKTNEYLDLQAQKVSLEKSRDSLIDLKAREGKIDELINLETRILNLEQQIQGLGVSLGDFDAENEFSTVKLFMAERKKQVISGPGIWKKLGSAALWTLLYYSLFWISIAAALVSLFIFLKLLTMLISAARLLDNAVRRE